MYPCPRYIATWWMFEDVPKKTRSPGTSGAVPWLELNRATAFDDRYCIAAVPLMMSRPVAIYQAKRTRPEQSNPRTLQSFGAPLRGSHWPYVGPGVGPWPPPQE